MNERLDPSVTVLDRRGRLVFTLAAPFIVLILSSLISWMWRSIGWPGAVGSLTPGSIVLLIACVGGSMYALRLNLPMRMLTWLPAGQGAIVLLTTGFIGTEPGSVAGLAVIVAYSLVFLIVLALALAIAAHGAPVAVTFVCLFVMTQAARFPVFELAADPQIAFAPWFTMLAGARSMVEIAILVWLVLKLVEAPEDQAGRVTVWIVVLAVCHGLFAGWQDPLLRGALSFTEIGEQWIRWLMFLSIQLGMASVLIRFRRAWGREQPYTEVDDQYRSEAPDEFMGAGFEKREKPSRRIRHRR